MSDINRAFQPNVIHHAAKWLYWNGKLYYLHHPELLRAWLKWHKPRKKFGITEPFIIYQMSKVGSSTIVTSLKKMDLDVPLYHNHFLNDFDGIETSTRAAHADPREALAVIADGRRLRQEIDRTPTRRWNVVCLVRRPIARDVSSFFQGIASYIPDAQARYANGTLSLSEIEQVFLEKHYHHTDEYWFDTQVKPVFDIDVYATPFPQAQGYAIYTSRNARLLLMRLEDMNRVAARAFQEAFGIPHMELIAANVGAEKSYRDMYQDFQKRSHLPTPYLDSMIHTRFARHFYSDAEVAEDYGRWQRASA